MSWTWHWDFLVSIWLPMILLAVVARFAMNRSNVEKDGPEADIWYALRTRPVQVIIAWITAGIGWALIVTGVAGFFL